MPNLMPAVLFSQSGSLLVSGTSPQIQAPGINGIVILVKLLAIAGGTTPSLTVSMDEIDSFGNTIASVFNLAALSTAFASAETDFHGSFPGTYAVRWTVAGAPTTLNAAITLYGVP